jgi:pilus assembly protein Flp/PilA
MGLTSKDVGRVAEALVPLEIDMQKIRSFLKNSKGATAIEYGLIAALIAVAAIAAMKGLGNQLGTTFNSVSGKMATEATPK